MGRKREGMLDVTFLERRANLMNEIVLISRPFKRADERNTSPKWHSLSFAFDEAMAIRL